MLLYRNDLQSCLPQSWWDRVLIGYYNGAEISLLSDNDHPDGTPEPGPELKQLAHELRCCPDLKDIAKLDERRFQITLEPKTIIPEDRLWEIANQIIHNSEVEGIRVVRSSHSVDILAPRVSKQLVVRQISSFGSKADDFSILTIGDRGRWPGNELRITARALFS